MLSATGNGYAVNTNLWVLTVTRDEFEWLSNTCRPQLNEALDATNQFDEGPAVALPVYENEWTWLVATLGVRETVPENLWFAVNTATPATSMMRMNREWVRTKAENVKKWRNETYLRNPIHPLFSND